jgi:hypothetical protein
MTATRRIKIALQGMSLLFRSCFSLWKLNQKDHKLCAAGTVEPHLKEELARLYHIPIPSQTDLPISYNVAPSQKVLTI